MRFTISLTFVIVLLLFGCISECEASIPDSPRNSQQEDPVKSNQSPSGQPTSRPKKRQFRNSETNIELTEVPKKEEETLSASEWVIKDIPNLGTIAIRKGEGYDWRAIHGALIEKFADSD